jgi:hypothetical protein
MEVGKTEAGLFLQAAFIKKKMKNIMWDIQFTII